MPSKQGPRLRVRLSHWDHPTFELPTDSHPFNNSVHFIVPKFLEPSTIEDVEMMAEEGVSQTINAGTGASAGADPGAILSAALQGKCFWLVHIKLGDLVSNLVTSGMLTQRNSCFSAVQAASTGSPDWAGGAVAFTPDGHLHMAVSKELHATLGLIGERFNIDINLTAKKFKPGDGGFCDKVIQCLNTKLQAITLACCCEVNGASCSPASILPSALPIPTSVMALAGSPGSQPSKPSSSQGTTANGKAQTPGKGKGKGKSQMQGVQASSSQHQAQGPEASSSQHINSDDADMAEASVHRAEGPKASSSQHSDSNDTDMAEASTRQASGSTGCTGSTGSCLRIDLSWDSFSIGVAKAEAGGSCKKLPNPVSVLGHGARNHQHQQHQHHQHQHQFAPGPTPFSSVNNPVAFSSAAPAIISTIINVPLDPRLLIR
eukprot:gene5210-18438_t